MSDSLALVRFADGELRVAWYASDPDAVVPLLFDLDRAGDLWAAGIDVLLELVDLASGADDPEDDEQVVIWADYGNGRSWTARASKEAGVLTDGEQATPDAEDGTPAWVPDEWLGAPSSPPAPLTHPAATAGRAVVPTVATSVPEPLDDAGLIDAATALLGGSLDGLLLARVVEAALARAADPPDDLAARLDPLLPLARKRMRSWDHQVTFVAAMLLELAGDPKNDDHLTFGSTEWRVPDPWFLLPPFCSEVIQRLRAREAGPLVSMPTEVTGAVASVADGGWPLDRLLATLRAGTADLSPLPPRPDWGAPAIWSLSRKRAASELSVTGEREFAMAATCRLHATWFCTLWPHQPERAVQGLWEVCLGDVERVPSWSNPPILGALCTWLATPGLSIGPAAAAACALALAAKADVTRAAGLKLVAVEGVAPLVGAAVATGVSGGAVKPRRVVDALTTAAPTDAFLVATGAAEGLAGHRDLARVVGLAADVAPSVPGAVVPGAVAAMVGISGAVGREATRLMAAVRR